MRKFLKWAGYMAVITAILLFTGCTTQQPPESAGPVVEIVERTDLLDSITIDHIITAEKQAEYTKKGLSVSFQNMQLTGDNNVSFDLILAADSGSFIMPVQAIVSYEKNVVDGRDSFSDIELYWGNIAVYGSEIIVTNLTRLMRFSLAELSSPHTTIDLSGVMGEEGYILSSAAEKGRYAFVYHTPREDGFAVFDENGIMIKKTELSTDGCHLVKTAEKGSLPFARDFTPAIVFTDSGDMLVSGQKSAWFYNMAEDILLSGEKPLAYAEKDGVEYGIYYLTATGRYKGTTPAKLFLALKTAKGSYQSAFFFNGADLLGSLANKMEMVIKAGKPLVTVPATGLEMDVNFSQKNVTPRYKISRDMLGGRMYVSADKKYELYPMETGDTTHIALKEISTGKIRFLGDLGTINHGAYKGETGFLADGRVYILGNDDFSIYNTDMEAVSPVWTLSDYMPLGENINPAGDSRVLVAALHTAKGETVAVYYDDISYENSADRYADINTGRLKATYKVEIFDYQGNSTATCQTDIQACEGYMPVSVYTRGGKIHITVADGNTAEVIAKGTIDLKTGAFTKADK